MEKRYFLLTAALAVMLAIGFSGNAASYLGITSVHAETVEDAADGEYTIQGRMWHASQDQASMGNAALVQPMTVIKQGDEVTLKMEFVSLSTNIFTGYIYKMYYFPDYTNEEMIPYLAEPKELTVMDYYENIYDSYNDPNEGLDIMAKGNWYPHIMTMPIKWNAEEMWVEVYVPVMEAISVGNGSQFSRLQLDWSTLTRKTELNPAMSPVPASTSTPTAGAGCTAEPTILPTPAPVSSTKDLDPRNLADGVYAVEGTMVKIDKTTLSMSNDAINHTMKLNVKEGNYSLTMLLKGLTIGKQVGYLGSMKYYCAGYTKNQYGSPVGELADAVVDSYQVDENGTSYPSQVTIPLIPEALEDAYVPLQVFVPIMEEIAEGTGTQPVFLKLDFSTLKMTTEDDDSFSKEEDVDTSGTEAKSDSKRSSIINNKSTLPTSTPSSVHKTSKKQITRDSDVAETLEQPAGESLADFVVASGESGIKESHPRIQAADTNIQPKKNYVPITMSIFAVLTGVLYKAKSREFFGKRGRR